MACQFVDSFDNYLPIATGILGKWQTAQEPNQIAIAVGQGRNNTNALFFNFGFGPSGSYVQRVLTASSTREIVGIAVRIDSFDAFNEWTLMRWYDIVTPQVSLTILPNGQMRVRSAAQGTLLGTTSVSVISATTVYFFLELDVTFNSTTGSVTLFSNGVQVLNLTNINTAPSGNNSVNTFRLGVLGDDRTLANAAPQVYYDDLYMFDSTGAYNNAPVGDCRVFCSFPNGAGSSTQFTPNGAAQNYQCVNEQTEDGDTTYVSDATVGQKDLYAHTPTPVNTNQVLAVQLDAVARKDNANARNIATTVLSSATAQDSTAHPVSQQYAWYLDILETDPATAIPFTKAGVDAMQIGVKVAS
jgi:hypothetical protein